MKGDGMETGSVWDRIRIPRKTESLVEQTARFLFNLSSPSFLSVSHTCNVLNVFRENFVESRY